MGCLQIDTDAQYDCDGDFVPAIKGKYHFGHPFHEPDEPAEVNNFKVYLGEGENRCEVTKYLCHEKIEELKAAYIEMMSD